MKPSEYIKDKSELSRLALDIVNEHPRGVSLSFIEGGRRIGKTVFCMKTAHQVFQYVYGLNREDAWNMVLDNMLFDLEDVDKIFNRLEGIDWEHIDKHWIEDKPILKIWDDVSMHGGKYRYQVDANLVDNLQRGLDIIGIAVTGFLMNAPERANILSFMREYHDTKVIRISQDPRSGSEGYDRMAFFSKWRHEGKGWKLRPDRPYTPFSCFIGDVDKWGMHEQWVYDKYESIRGKAITRNRQVFKEHIKMGMKIEPDKPEAEIVNEMGLPDGWDKDVDGGV